MTAAQFKRPIGRPRRDGRPQLTRADVFVSTAKLIAQDGYGGTSIRKIASDLDASPASIFNLFPSKEDILNELIEFAASPALDFYDRLAQFDLPAEVAFHKSLYEEVVAVASAGTAFPALFYLPELRKPEFQKAQKIRERMVTHYRQLIETAVSANIFEAADPSLSAEQAFQLSETCILAGPAVAHLSPTQNAEISVRFCMKGLLVKPASLQRIEKASAKVPITFDMPNIEQLKKDADGNQG